MLNVRIGPLTLSTRTFWLTVRRENLESIGMVTILWSYGPIRITLSPILKFDFQESRSIKKKGILLR